MKGTAPMQPHRARQRGSARRTGVAQTHDQLPRPKPAFSGQAATVPGSGEVGAVKACEATRQGLALIAQDHEDATLSIIAWPVGFGFCLWQRAQAGCLLLPLGGQWVKTRHSVSLSALSSP